MESLAPSIVWNELGLLFEISETHHHVFQRDIA